MSITPSYLAPQISRHRHDAVADNSKAKLVKYTLLSLAILLAVFAPLNYFAFHLYLIASIEAVSFLVIVAAMADFYKHKNLVRSSWLMVVIISILTLIVFWLVKAQYLTSVWLLFPPIFYFFLLGRQSGIQATALYALCIGAILTSQRNSWPVLMENNGAAIATLFASCLLFWLLIYRYECVRQEALDAASDAFHEGIQEKNALLTSIINSSADFIFAKDTHLRTFLCNETFANALGKHPDDLYGKNDIENGWPAELVKGAPEKGIRGFERDDLDALGGLVIHNEYDPATVNGNLRIFDTIKLPLRNADGETIGVLGVARDVTGRKQAEMEKEQYLRFFMLSLDLMCIAGADGFFKKVNPAFTRTLGYSEQELLEKPLTEFIVPEDRQATLDEVAKQLQGGVTLNFENRYLCKDGSFCCLSWSAYMDDSDGLLYATARDITERKQIDLYLRTIQDDLNSMLNAIPDLLFELGLDGRYYNIRATRADLLAAPPEILLGRLVSEILPPEAAAICLAALQEADENGYSMGRQFELMLEQGNKWFELSVARKEGVHANGPRFMVLSRDITERKQVENELRERNAQLSVMAIDLATTEERERQKIAQELHDGLGQDLAVAKLKLSALDCTFDNGIKREVTAIETLLDQSNHAVRSLSMQLSPPVLNTLRLVPSLEWLADEMQRSFDLHVNVHTDGLPELVKEALLNLIFRTTRELLINVAKHARVGVAELAATRAEDCLIISVTDAGAGFEAHTIPMLSGKGNYGLFSVRERITLIGGSMQIDSRPGDGTVVVMTVPLAGK